MTGKDTRGRLIYDPLTELIGHFAEQKAEKKEPSARPAEVEERLKLRIIDGDKVGLQADLDEALGRYSALDIINTVLLDGMKVVGELFGSGQMQLPFVLQSAEVMKAAVAYLEPFMDKAASSAKGVLVLATVKGDVHDIGKNLVDIILTNNGYRVVNLGIKCPIDTMLQAAQQEQAQAIGMSGLLVKSTLIMKENLAVMNERGITLPVILGGAALTRRYVEDDLRALYKGVVLYAKDAFAGLRFMEQIAGGTLEASGQGPSPADDAEVLTGTEAKMALARQEDSRYQPSAGTTEDGAKRSAVRSEVPIPHPPFWGVKVVETIDLDEVFPYINDVALIRGQWQVRKGAMSEEDYRALLQEKVYPELAALKEQVQAERLLEPRVVYGYFPCWAEGDDLVVLEDDQQTERLRFTFPRQKDDRHLCLADYFAPRDSGRVDVVAFDLVTMGRVASEYSSKSRSNRMALKSASETVRKSGLISERRNSNFW